MLASAITLALAQSAPTLAATILVTSPGDAGTATTCTLRQAVLSMSNSTLSGNCQNSGAAFGSSNTIRFAPSISTITLADVPSGQITIGIGDLVIDAGAGRTVVVERPANAVNRFSVMHAQSPSNAFLPFSNLTLIGLLIQGGHADNALAKYGNEGAKYAQSAGGGISGSRVNFTLDRCTIRNNRADQGGAVFTKGLLTMRSSTITGNRAFRLGGGAVTHSGISMRDSTVSGNIVESGAAGGIASHYGALNLTNTTITGNVASRGAAIVIGFPILPSLFLNSTIACNNGLEAVLVRRTPEAAIDAFSTIFANTTNTRCTTATQHEFTVLEGSMTVGGQRNLVARSLAIHPSAPFATMPTTGDPLLGPLQGNGGTTAGHMPGATSPAVNAGSNPSGLVHDQRGADFSRATGFATDIGAIETTYGGLCGAAHGKSFASLTASSPNLCSAGAYLQDGMIFGSGPWSWFCAAAGVSSNEFCGATLLANVGLAATTPGGAPLSTAVFGQPVRLRATVSGSTSTPTGTVSFFDTTSGTATSVCASVPLSGTVATCAVPATALVAGQRQLKAVFNGNGTYGTVASTPVALTITRATTTTAAPSVSPDPATVTQPVTVSASVAVASPSTATAIGTVTIEDLTDGLACTYAAGAGSTDCSLTPLTAGAHTLRATFEGSDAMIASSAERMLTVERAPATISIDAAATIAFGQSIDVIAAVTAGVPSPVPTGSILVSDGVQTCSFDLTLTDRCTLIPGQHGTLTLTADYQGDATYAPATASRSLAVVPHTVGGMLGGLAAGGSVVLRMQHDNGNASRTLVANGTFRFDDIVRYASPYLVTVVSSPSSPPQACTVAGGNGTMPAQDVDNVVVTCGERLFADGFDP